MDLAAATAEKAGAYIASAAMPLDPQEWDTKGASDFVTAVDRESEELIAEMLLAAEPNSAVLGEELTGDLSPGKHPSDLLWIVDPLDGTTNYLHHYPAYAVSIAAVVQGSIVAGAVYHIENRESFTAAAGHGAWNGSTRLRVSATSNPKHSLIGTGFPFKSVELIPRYLEQFSKILEATSGVRRAGAAALDLVDVALGRFEGFWELQLAPWDVAAGTLLIREAGGNVTSIDGSTEVLHHGSLVAGNSAIHSWLLEILNV